MSKFIDLNSEFRDREAFPNPFSYELYPKQVSTWFNFDRTTRSYGQNPGIDSIGFVTTVSLKSITLPYSELLAGEPRVYVNFGTLEKTSQSTRLIQTIDNRLPEATFVCPFLSIQNDGGGDPAWIHYKCDITPQTMRFTQNYPIRFTVTLRDGTIIIGADTPIPDPPDPTAQTFATFELIPFIKNAAYENHMVDTFRPS